MRDVEKTSVYGQIMIGPDEIMFLSKGEQFNKGFVLAISRDFHEYFGGKCVFPVFQELSEGHKVLLIRICLLWCTVEPTKMICFLRLHRKAWRLIT
jgi:hypothetical protein